MGKSSLNPTQAWKSFLNFGEELIKQSNAISLSQFFCDFVSENVGCQAHLWLAEPFYPLPGEPPTETIQSSKPSRQVLQTFKQKAILFSDEGNKTSGNFLKHTATIPVITQGNLLAVLEVSREQGPPFSEIEIESLEGMTAYGAVAMQVNRQVALKNWRYDQIALVRSVSSQIANILDLDELCRRVTNLIQCSFEYYHVAIFTLDHGKEELHFRASSLECEPTMSNPYLSVKYGEGLVGTTAQTGKEFIVGNVAKESLYRSHQALPRTKSEVVLPLTIEKRILGVLDIQSEKIDAFHENDMLVLRSLADNIALAVEGARLYESLKQRARLMSASAEVSYALSSILDLEELLQEIVGVIHRQFGIPVVNMFTVHSGRRKVIFQAGSGVSKRKQKPTSFAYDLDASQGIIPEVARTGITLLANDVTKEPLYKPSRIHARKTKSELSIPLKFGDEVLGVLDLQSDQVDYFKADETELFESLASGIALSIRNATLFRTERWRRDVADSFRDIAGILSSNLALPELLERILISLETNLPCDASAIWLLDEVSTLPINERPLRLAAVRGTSSEKIIESTESSVWVRNYLNFGLESNEVQIRKPDDPYGPLGAACGFPANYSSLAVPLRSGDEVMGVLTLAHRTSGRYGSEASAISATLASYAAVAIQNARLYTTAQEEAWSSTVLLQVSEALQSITSVENLLATMVRLTPLMVGIDQCAIFLTSFNRETFEMKHWYGFQPGEEELVLRDTESIGFLKVNATHAPVFINDPAAELGLPSLNHSDKTGTIVLLPLMAHGELHGAFLVSHNSKGDYGVQNRFSDQTLAILQGIVQQTSVGMENIRLLESRQEEAYVTAVLLQVAQAVVSLNELEEILDTIVQLMPILVGVDVCAVFLWDKAGECFIPSKAIAPSKEEFEELLGTVYPAASFPLLDLILEKDEPIGCRLGREPFSILEWKSITTFENLEGISGENGNWLLGFPLSTKGEKYGVMVAREMNVKAEYHQKRVELIRGVAQQTALAIQNERLKEEMVGRERVEREFQLARQIQQTFLPQSLPMVDGWDLDLRWRTAREVGGDFYDSFLTRDNKIALVIADVSDKGMPAALYMTVTRTLIRATSQSLDSPAAILQRVNELLVIESQNGMFVTAIFALLDPATGDLEYANAGHNLPLVFRGGTSSVDILSKGGIALGVIDDAVYGNLKIHINTGDTLLFYTDGVTEAFSSSGEQFSESRLIDALTHSPYESAGQLLLNLENLIIDFRNGEPPSDDLTMIAVHRSKKAPA